MLVVAYLLFCCSLLLRDSDGVKVTLPDDDEEKEEKKPGAGALTNLHELKSLSIDLNSP